MRSRATASAGTSSQPSASMRSAELPTSEREVDADRAVEAARGSAATVSQSQSRSGQARRGRR